MDPSPSFSTDVSVFHTNEPELPLHKPSGKSQKRRPSSSCPEEGPTGVKRPKLSHTGCTEPAERAVPSSRASTTVHTGRVTHDSTKDPLLDSEHVDIPRQRRSGNDTVDYVTEDTSLMAEEEVDHQHMLPQNTGSAAGTEDLNQDWDLAQIGTFVDEEAITEALLTAPEEVLDDVASRLEGILRAADAVLSDLRPALDTGGRGDI
ncbi:hypothetical protein AYO20_09697 [Fonsecaea nubica]|uniref:Uncharacterized protein n=1 Tax=Fonsecaea nubica TaxID=856822 RepID=A0A178CER9_9EURO|nr:hypothetical protein AYO20_09697 [Fonsecaea nubica]OAL27844.1 hypothetical protein AYO20_09697 [Fonsecaea nubica]